MTLRQQMVFLRLFTVSVYISLQLRTEKEKQTPVIETSQQIPIVPVRARRSVPAGVCVWQQMNTAESQYSQCACKYSHEPFVQRHCFE